MKKHKLISAVLTLALALGLILPSNVTSASAAGTPAVAVYRLYLHDNGEHLFTTDYNEVTVLSTQHGWTYEGVGWYAPQSGTAVYRLYNAALQNHLYTTDLNEIRVLTTSEGWTMDFDGQPLFYSGGDVPIYRLYNRALRGLHLWTTDTNEYNELPSEGWAQENVALYGVDPDSYGQTDHTHTWNAGKVTTPASCTATGVKTYTCTVCGATKTETIPMTDHTYVDHVDIQTTLTWVPGTNQKVTVCSCGARFDNVQAYDEHALAKFLAGDPNHSNCGVITVKGDGYYRTDETYTIDYQYCIYCGAKKP